jgi:signal transduction histidine kinase
MDELRSVVFELRPASLEAEGLGSVLRKHVDVLRRVSDRPIELTLGDPPRLPAEQAAQVFRIAQEALQNALRHADAEHITVQLDGGAGGLVLSVADDGCGFDVTARAVRGRRLGLTSMEERAAELGGVLEIVSVEGEGTSVRLAVSA